MSDTDSVLSDDIVSTLSSEEEDSVTYDDDSAEEDEELSVYKEIDDNGAKLLLNRYKNLTKYERTMIIGQRIAMLQRGAPSTLSHSEIKGLTEEEIAIKELEEGVSIYTVSRPVPGSDKSHIFSVNDLLLKSSK